MDGVGPRGALPFDELAALRQRIVVHKLMSAIAQLHVVCGRVYTPSQVWLRPPRKWSDSSTDEQACNIVFIQAYERE